MQPVPSNDVQDVQGSTTSPKAQKESFLQAFPKWWKVAKQWFFSDECWKARTFLAIAIILSLIRTLMLVKISYVHRRLETALAEKDKDNFRGAISTFGRIIVLAAPLFAVAAYVEDRFKLEWRNWLTKELFSGYYTNLAFYKLHQYDSSLDNPDQRICDDVPAFTEGSTHLLIGITRKALGVIAFSGVLWTVAPSLVLFLFVYTGIGTWLTVSVFGKRLMQLTFTVLKQEGDLRFNLVRTRENSESIAFYTGEARESLAANSRLAALVACSKRKIAWLAGLSLWSNAYSFATVLLPILLTAPRYFAGEVELGVLTQVGFAFRHIEEALNYLMDNLDKFSGLAAEAERLNALSLVLKDRSEERYRIQYGRGSEVGLVVDGLTLSAPTGSQLICQGLDLVVGQKESLLIVGPSGCGKSSLLRAIAGLWTSGTGVIYTPDVRNMFFLPQKPYMPLGTLRQQLLYPSGEQHLGLLDQPVQPMVSDADLLELLERVSLKGLVDRVGGFESTVEFSHILSLGEQQRVAFLRLLLHKPVLAFLDEATGALDTTTESLLYKALQEQSQSYVSVGHRKELLAFHSLVLEHQGGWKWKLLSVTDYQRQHSS